MPVLCLLLELFKWTLFARVLLSWVPRLPEGLRPVAEVIYTLTDPIVRAARPLIPPIRIGMVSLDVSILLVFIVLELLSRAICFR